MRIAFVCSSLEPGRDGVGDYCRGLAEELTALGHEAALVAFNDRFIADFAAVQETPALLRLPRNLEWKKKTRLARAFLDKFQPGWVSIQFVCYGFNDRGIVAGQAKHLKALAAGRRAHVMLHELWIGEESGASLKHWVIGRIQKACILSFLKQLKPDAAHVADASFRGILARNGFRAGLLPLFGNIPIVTPAGWMAAELLKLGVTPENRGEYCIIGVFGAIPPEWSVEDFLQAVSQPAGELGKRLILLTIGIHSPESLEKLRAISGRIPVVSFGPETPEHISEFLREIDFGAATSPWSLLGKSGAAAAMLEHGLPVLVFRDDEDFRVEIVQNPRFIKMDLKWNSLRAAKQPPRRARPEIAESLLRDMKAAEAGTSPCS